MPSKSRIHGAVLDIFRQFGYTEFADNRNTVKIPACAADDRCVAFIRL